MLRLGIIGFGHIGRIHAEAAGHVPNVELTAIGTSRPDEARRLCGPDVRVFTHHADLLQLSDLDAVIVSVPTYLHERLVVEALDRGLSVLCEKPFALDLSSAQRMLDAARRRQKCLMIAQVLRFWPPYVRIKQLADDGTIGPIAAIAAYRLAQYPPWGDWFRDPLKSGGAILDLQIHDADFVYWLLGSPQEVYAAGLKSSEGSWDQVTSLLRYPHSVATLESTYLMPIAWPFTCGIRVTGSRGCVEFLFRVGGNVERREQAESSLRLYAHDGSVTEPAVVKDDMYAAQLRYFVECLTRKQSPDQCPPEETVEVMRIMSACQQSLATRIPIHL
jgi:UDP-N-acetylglucosamine 3-dehydrogenase